MGSVNVNQKHDVAGERERPLDRPAAEGADVLDEVDGVDVAGEVGGDFLEFVEASCGPWPDAAGGRDQERRQGLPPFALRRLVPAENTAEVVDEPADGGAGRGGGPRGGCAS